MDRAQRDVGQVALPVFLLHLTQLDHLLVAEEPRAVEPLRKPRNDPAERRMTILLPSPSLLSFHAFPEQRFSREGGKEHEGAPGPDSWKDPEMKKKEEISVPPIGNSLASVWFPRPFKWTIRARSFVSCSLTRTDAHGAHRAHGGQTDRHGRNAGTVKAVARDHGTSVKAGNVGLG